MRRLTGWPRVDAPDSKHDPHARAPPRHPAREQDHAPRKPGPARSPDAVLISSSTIASGFRARPSARTGRLGPTGPCAATAPCPLASSSTIRARWRPGLRIVAFPVLYDGPVPCRLSATELPVHRPRELLGRTRLECRRYPRGRPRGGEPLGGWGGCPCCRCAPRCLRPAGRPLCPGRGTPPWAISPKKCSGGRGISEIASRSRANTFEVHRLRSRACQHIGGHPRGSNRAETDRRCIREPGP